MTGAGELETLQPENEQLRADLKRALAAIEKLEVENKRLREDLEKLKREKHRSAAPFSVLGRTAPVWGLPTATNPNNTLAHPVVNQVSARSHTGQHPARKRSQKPCQSHLNRTPANHAAIYLEPGGFRFAWISELPELKTEIIEFLAPQQHLTGLGRYQLERKTCPTCRVTVQATHPMVSSNQVGATARHALRALHDGLALEPSHWRTACSTRWV